MEIKVHPIVAGIGHSFLVESETGLILIDTGSPGNERLILSRMTALNRTDLRLIFITHGHFDHYGSAAALRRETGAPIAIHSADAQDMARGVTTIGSTREWGFMMRVLLPLGEKVYPPTPTPADWVVEDGDRLDEYGLDAAILHTPGHTPGSCTLLVNGTVAFVGDLLSRNPGPGIQRLVASRWEDFAASLARLQDARPEWVYTGHSSRPLTGDWLQSLTPGKTK